MLKQFVTVTLLSAAFGAAPAKAQSRTLIEPDCVIGFTYINTAVGNALQYQNVMGCVDWRLTYYSTGFSAVSIVIQSAPDNAGAPGTFVTFVGTVLDGINPNTSTTSATTQVFGYNRWMRVLLTTATGGPGTVSGILEGCRQPGCAANASPTPVVAPCPGTSGTPCVVDGPNAAGTAPTKPPVLVAGQDGGPLVRVLSTDTSGDLNVNVLNTPTISGSVQILGNGAVLSGQQAVTGSAVALATNAAKTICVKADLANTITVFMGPSGVTTGTGIKLDPGDATCQPVSNTNLLFVIASTTGASVSWIGTN